MNRPHHGPCWVVYRSVEPRSTIAANNFGASSRLVKLYLRAPNRVDDYVHYVTRRAEDGRPRPGTFSIYSVEPFTNEVDAIAAALLIDGVVLLIEEGAYRDAESRP